MIAAEAAPTNRIFDTEKAGGADAPSGFCALSGFRGLGATLGPYMGGKILAQTDDLYIGAKLAVIGSAVSVLLSLIFLPSEVGNASVEDGKASSSSSLSRSFLQEAHNSMQMAIRPNLWPLLTVKTVSGVASSMFQTALPMVLTQQLHFDPAALGLSMSASMLASAAFGIIGMGSATRLLGAMGMAQGGLCLRPVLGMLVAFIVSQQFSTSNKSDWIAGSHQRILVIAVSVLHSLASHALATGVTTQTTGVVQPDEQGTLLGLEHGLFSMARIGGPTAGTHLLTVAGFGAVVAACTAIDIPLLVILVVKASQIKAGRSLKAKDP